MRWRTYPLLAAVLLSLSVSAAGSEYFYVGAGVGAADARDACGEFADLGFHSGCDDTDTALKLFAGYRYSPNLALEGFYIDFGEASARSGGTRLSAEPDAFGVSVVGLWPASREIDLFAKMGVFYWNMEGRTQQLNLDGDDLDVTFGIGAQYLFRNQFALRLELERFSKVGNPDTFQTDIDLLSLNASFSFY